MSSPDLSVAKQLIAAELAAQTGRLDLSALKLTELPPELRDLTSLQELDCSGTQVSDLEPLRGLASLHELDCSQTQVSELEPLRGLTSLEHLNCWDTQVSDLEQLRDLTSLQHLDCWDTQVRDLEPLRGLTRLQELDCSDTQVSDLEPLVNLQTLKTLECRNLKISEFPRKLLFSEILQKLYLSGASIPDIPEEAFSSDKDDPYYNCLPAFRAHVLDLEVEAIPINSVKILVLGNGEVGKTQLCRYLAAEAFDPTVPSTHGIALRTITPASDGDATY